MRERYRGNAVLEMLKDLQTRRAQDTKMSVQNLARIVGQAMQERAGVGVGPSDEELSAAVEYLESIDARFWYEYLRTSNTGREQTVASDVIAEGSDGQIRRDDGTGVDVTLRLPDRLKPTIDDWRWPAGDS